MLTTEQVRLPPHGPAHRTVAPLRFAWPLVIALLLLPAPKGIAGPPFLTDDPDPVPYHHWEAYLFMAADRTRGAQSVTGPAVEVNNGIAPNTQLHLIVPISYYSANGQSATGLGDTELGVKYRFVEQTHSRPEIGTFPQLELPTGDSSRGLGNGRTWLKAPIWLEKDWGAWTTYGGVGYAYNPAPGQRNYAFGGWLLQRAITSTLSLGGEVFLQGAQVTATKQTTISQVPGTRSTAIYNLGGQLNFTPDFSLLFSAGHSFQGEGNAVLYIGLYRTWGPGSP